MKSFKIQTAENQTINYSIISIDIYLVGMTGFEPATTRPPAVYANRTAPHPENRLQKY